MNDKVNGKDDLTAESAEVAEIENMVTTKQHENFYFIHDKSCWKNSLAPYGQAVLGVLWVLCGEKPFLSRCFSAEPPQNGAQTMRFSAALGSTGQVQKM